MAFETDAKVKNGRCK